MQCMSSASSSSLQSWYSPFVRYYYCLYYYFCYCLYYCLWYCLWFCLFTSVFTRALTRWCAPSRAHTHTHIRKYTRPHTHTKPHSSTHTSKRTRTKTHMYMLGGCARSARCARYARCCRPFTLYPSLPPFSPSQSPPLPLCLSGTSSLYLSLAHSHLISKKKRSCTPAPRV